MGRKNVIFLLGLLLMIIELSAQNPPRLILLKGNNRIAEYKEGDFIRFKRKDRNHFNRGAIAGMTEDYIRIQDDTTFIAMIEKVDLTGGEKSGSKARFIGGTLMIAGALLFFGDMFNETVVNDNAYKADAAVTTVSAILVGTGLMLQFVDPEMYSVGRRKRMVVLTN
ncbi:MAG: hypothetical protein MUE95_11855 [Cyclobacteriaceae bacterium]|jgi:hypothetical protein|nr:hypothetical protein [Cyclobacteriaceae bacterium]